MKQEHRQKLIDAAIYIPIYVIMIVLYNILNELAIADILPFNIVEVVAAIGTTWYIMQPIRGYLLKRRSR